MDLSIIIVNWNSAEFLKVCLQSILFKVTGLQYEVIVIDNASFDGSREVINELPSFFQFIQSRINMGFARANNFAAREANSDCLLFLNPDTEIEKGTVEKMHSVLHQHTEAGVVGCRILNTDRTLQNTSVHPFPTILNQILDSEFLRNKFSHWNLWGMNPLITDSKIPVEVAVISGACMMIQKKLFDEIGGFNNIYFMYSEDVDLCYRVRKKCKRNLFIPDVEIIHHSGRSTIAKTSNIFAPLQFRESRYIFFKIHKGYLYSEVYRYAMLFSALFRIAFLLLKSYLAWDKSKRCIARDRCIIWRQIARWCLRLVKPMPTILTKK